MLKQQCFVFTGMDIHVYAEFLSVHIKILV